MQRPWELTTSWETLETGTPEERSCFAAIGIRAHSVWLTEGYDSIANRLRQAPYLSAYALAEWLAWNWWRLRWEPRSMAQGWRFSHRLSNIGGGYIWPDITIFSDGERTALLTKPTPERAQTPFRYINQVTPIITSSEFEYGVDCFIDQVLERLDATGVKGTNLAAIWHDVLEERQDTEQGGRRKIEALLGMDPDESDPNLIDEILSESHRLGLTAVEELVADSRAGHAPSAVFSAEKLIALANQSGIFASFKDGVQLDPIVQKPSRSEIPAWQLGVETAKRLRSQENLGGDVIQTTTLSGLIGIRPADLDHAGYSHAPGVSFALKQGESTGKIFLRSRYATGQRFELARLLADRLLSKNEEILYPATRAATYRQKAQRAFAAELLSPFEHVMTMLDGDFSPENQQDIAEHFQVSELTIRTQLVNHHVLDRDELDSGEFAFAA